MTLALIVNTSYSSAAPGRLEFSSINSTFLLSLQNYKIPSKFQLTPDNQSNTTNSLSSPPNTTMAPAAAWTQEQRLAVHLLETQFSHDDATKVGIFNTLFDKQATAATLGSAYRDRNRAERAHLWAPVLTVPKSIADITRRQEMTARIRDCVPRIAAPGETAAGEGSSTPAGNLGGKKRPRAGHRAVSYLTSPTLPSRNVGEHHTEAEYKPTPAESEEGEETVSPRKADLTSRANDQPLTKTNDGPRDRTRLQMVHFSEVVWEGTQPYWWPEDGGELPTNSAAYLRGGKAHQVIISTTEKWDLMICDPAFCPKCGPNRDLAVEEGAQGLPQVHVSDVLKQGGKYVFHPTPKAHSTAFLPGWERTLHFEASGEVVAKALLCQFERCGVCPSRRRGGSEVDETEDGTAGRA